MANENKRTQAIDIATELQLAANELGEQLYRQAQERVSLILEQEPNHLEANFLKALIYFNQEQDADAKLWFLKVLELDPKHIAAISNLALLAARNEDMPEALDHFKDILKQQPDNAECLNNMGSIHAIQGGHEAAIPYFRKAVALEPDNVKYLKNIARSLKKVGEPEECKRYHQHAYELVLQPLLLEAENQPTNTQLLNKIAELHFNQDKYEEALAVYQEILCFNPMAASTLGNIAVCYRRLNRYPEALVVYQRLLSLSKPDSRLMHNIAICFSRQNQHQQAIQYYREAIKLADDDAAVDQCLLGFELLADGQFQEGFNLYEWRFKRYDLIKAERIENLQRWQGQPLADKRIVVIAEQGHGDMIQAFRFIPYLKEQGAYVITETLPALKRLLSMSDYGDEIISKEEPVPAADYFVPVMDLPKMYFNKVAEAAHNIPYVHADKNEVAEMAKHFKKYFKKSNKLKVGFIWTGNPQQADNDKRSVNFDFFADLAESVDAEFYSLQVGYGWRQAKDVERFKKAKIVDLAPHIDDFASTAALMSHLDVVISVCTSSLHLAAAMGIPTWFLQCYSPDWRWYQPEGGGNLWYPELKIFRQERIGHWGNVFKDLQAELAKINKLEEK